MQAFYRNQDRKQKMAESERKFEEFMLTIAPDSVFARKLKIDCELELIRQDLLREENRAKKSEHHERWARKDPWATYPVYRDLALYTKKTPYARREKDPWAAYRLF